MEAGVGVHLLQNVTLDNWTVKGMVKVFYTQLSATSPLIGDIDTEALEQVNILKSNVLIQLVIFSIGILS